MAPAKDKGDAAPTTWKGLRLLDFQLRALEAIRKEQNVLVSAPTGAGKTLVAEYAMADAVRRGKRCVYTAPIKALSNQKYRDFRDDPEIDVGLMTGDVTIHPGAQVLIMTTEIFRNAIFENLRGLDEIEYVIFDEIHYMDDVERGSVWEESLIFAPEDIRFISLSATIANLDQLGSWMREIRRHELTIIRSDRRPVPLKHRLWTRRARPFAIDRLAYAQREEGRPRRSGGHGRRGRDRRRRDEDERGLRPLFDWLQDESLLPALVFSFSRKDCERLARWNRSRELLNEEESRRMRVLQEELIEAFQLAPSELNGEVFHLASHGVGFHHAGMLPVHKEVVERLFTSGLLKLIFTTETFALGINMPARAVAFASLRKFDGIQFDYMRTRDYLQMAGRAGRQGMDDEGLVISTLDARDLREAPLRRMLSGRPEPVVSRFRLSYATILHLMAGLGREKVHEAWEKSFNQYQHRAKSRKARERNGRLQRDLVDRHLALLAHLRYMDGEDRLTPKGELARVLYGYELQIAELMQTGELQGAGSGLLSAFFVSLVYEDRRRGPGVRVPARFFGGERARIDRHLAELAGTEAEYGIPNPMKLPDWGLTEAVLAWHDGATFDELEDASGIPGGDLCRTLRMSVQLMRQVRRSVEPGDPLHGHLEEGVRALNRDVVDARRQLELG